MSKEHPTLIARNLRVNNKTVVRSRNAAYWEGFDAFKKNAEFENPYHRTTSEGCDYAAGWEGAKKYEDEN